MLELLENKNWSIAYNTIYSESYIENWKEGYKFYSFDEIDHEIYPEKMLNDIKHKMNRDDFLKIRCHPWCSRNGGHYGGMENKAFVHLIFDNNTLKQKFGIGKYTNKIYYPLDYYSKIFNSTGFNIVKMNVTRVNVDNFFKRFDNIFSKLWNCEFEKNGICIPFFHMSIEYVDYLLKIK